MCYHVAHVRDMRTTAEERARQLVERAGLDDLRAAIGFRFGVACQPRPRLFGGGAGLAESVGPHKVPATNGGNSAAFADIVSVKSRLFGLVVVQMFDRHGLFDWLIVGAARGDVGNMTETARMSTIIFSFFHFSCKSL